MKVGFSGINITPDLEKREKPLQLAGYSPRKLCTGIHDDLFARAVYFEGKEDDITSHILLIMCDILNISGSFADIIKKYISKSIPINPENIMVSATHTHHGPDYDGAFRPGGNLALFKGFLFPRPQIRELINLGKKIIQSAKEAYKNRRQAKIGAGQTEISEEDRVMINRREIFNFEKAKYPITIIKVISDAQETQGEIIGLIINYACHGTVLPFQNTLITADYICYVIKAFEKKFTSKKGNFVFFNGPCGELNPLSKKLKIKMKKYGPSGVKNTDIYQQKGTFNDAKRIGETIAKYALKIVDDIKCKNYKNISVIQKIIKIPVKDYNYGSNMKSALIRLFFRIKLRIFSVLKKLKVLKSTVFFNIDNLDLKGTVKTPIQIINIGDILIATVPGEYFLELGNEVINHARTVFPSKIAFMIELANDSIGYLYTIKAYMEGGYESAFSVIPLGGRFITMKLKKLITNLKNSS